VGQLVHLRSPRKEVHFGPPAGGVLQLVAGGTFCPPKRETSDHAQTHDRRRTASPIYTLLRRHLTSIDDIRILADDDPGRLALQFADDFRLFKDIGWDRDDPRDSIRLTMPPTDLRRVLMRLQAEAEGALTATTEEEREEIREDSVAAREACRDLLDVLDAELEGRRHGACI
jgi:hypothetical protein